MSVFVRICERRGFGKEIQPGYRVHGASYHHFLCLCLDPSVLDLSRFPTTAFNGAEAKVCGSVFRRRFRVRIR